MTNERPSIRQVNGYDVIQTSKAVFKVYDSDRQHGPDFESFEEAAEYALRLPSLAPLRS